MAELREVLKWIWPELLLISASLAWLVAAGICMALHHG